MLTSLPLFQQNENIFASKFPRTVLSLKALVSLGLAGLVDIKVSKLPISQLFSFWTPQFFEQSIREGNLK